MGLESFPHGGMQAASDPPLGLAAGHLNADRHEPDERLEWPPRGSVRRRCGVSLAA